MEHMEHIHKKINKLEINQLCLSLEKLRKHPSSAYLKMAESLTHYSQLMPVIVVSDEKQGLILVDGYLRIRALQKLGVDLCDGEIWECDLAMVVCIKQIITTHLH